MPRVDAQELLRTGVPRELRGWPALPYREVRRSTGRVAKVPLGPAGRPCNHRDSQNQVAYAVALEVLGQGGADGVGVVIPPGHVLVDFDDCLVVGQLEPWVAGTVARLGSYTERSVSGRGLKTFARGEKPGGRCRGERCELYGTGWYAALTGQGFGAFGVADAAAEIARLYAELFPEPGSTSPTVHSGAPPGLTTGALLERALAANNGDRLRRLYLEGDVTGYASRSEADFALLRMLRFWAGDDPLALDTLMRGSALMRARWDEPAGRSYGARSIQRAISLGGAVWQPPAR